MNKNLLLSLIMVFSLGICSSYSQQNQSKQREKTYEIIKVDRSANIDNVTKQFDLNDIDWDFYRQLDKRTLIELENTGIQLQILSVNELSERNISVNKLKFEKMAQDRKERKINLDKLIIFSANESGEVFEKENRVKIQKLTSK